MKGVSPPSSRTSPEGAIGQVGPKLFGVKGSGYPDDPYTGNYIINYTTGGNYKDIYIPIPLNTKNTTYARIKHWSAMGTSANFTNGVEMALIAAICYNATPDTTDVCAGRVVLTDTRTTNYQACDEGTPYFHVSSDNRAGDWFSTGGAPLAQLYMVGQAASEAFAITITVEWYDKERAV